MIAALVAAIMDESTAPIDALLVLVANNPDRIHDLGFMQTREPVNQTEKLVLATIKSFRLKPKNLIVLECPQTYPGQLKPGADYQIFAHSRHIAIDGTTTFLKSHFTNRIPEVVIFRGDEGHDVILRNLDAAKRSKIAVRGGIYFSPKPLHLVQEERSDWPDRTCPIIGTWARPNDRSQISIHPPEDTETAFPPAGSLAVWSLFGTKTSLSLGLVLVKEACHNELTVINTVNHCLRNKT